MSDEKKDEKKKERKKTLYDWSFMEIKNPPPGVRKKTLADLLQYL